MMKTLVLYCLLASAAGWESQPYGPPRPSYGGFNRRGGNFASSSQSQSFGNVGGSSHGYDGPSSRVRVSTGFYDNHIGPGGYGGGPIDHDGPHPPPPLRQDDGHGHYLGPGPEPPRYEPKTIVREVEVPRVVYREVPKVIVKEVPRYITKEVERVVVKEIPKTIVREVEVPRIVVKEVPVTKTIVKERPVPKIVYKDVEVPQVVVRKIPKTIIRNVEVPEVHVNHVPVHHEVHIATPVVAVNRALHVKEPPLLPVAAPVTTAAYATSSSGVDVATKAPALSIGGSLIAPVPVPVVPATPARAVYGPARTAGSLVGDSYSDRAGLTGTLNLPATSLRNTQLGLGDHGAVPYHKYL